MLVLIMEPTWSFGQKMKRGPSTLIALLEKVHGQRLDEVFQFVPPTSAGFGDGVMVDQIAGEGARRAIVKKN
jgi:hypothetical protein